MSNSPSAPQRPLSASAVRRILDGLDDLTQTWQVAGAHCFQRPSKVLAAGLDPGRIER